jgi:NAD(P)-dependent dehydrogenase (short-subunit alcohol dehydrogenase family)
VRGSGGAGPRSMTPPAYPKVALVTGAGKRIGRAAALMLGKEGWAVAVHYGRSRADAESAVREIVAGGGRAVAIGADLAREAEVERLVPQVVEALGPLGALVNNASVFENDAALGVTRESWDRHMETNLRAPFVLIQHFARQLPADAVGAVINILDERVWNLTPYFVSYTLSKAALWTLTQTLALALAPRIRVNAVGPGPALPSPRQSETQFRRQQEMMPLERGTSPEEIAAAVRFILQAPAMTGQMIALDGGQHLGWAQAGGRPPLEE